MKALLPILLLFAVLGGVGAWVFLGETEAKPARALPRAAEADEVNGSAPQRLSNGSTAKDLGEQLTTKPKPDALRTGDNPANSPARPDASSRRFRTEGGKHEVVRSADEAASAKTGDLFEEATADGSFRVMRRLADGSAEPVDDTDVTAGNAGDDADSAAKAKFTDKTGDVASGSVPSGPAKPMNAPDSTGTRVTERAGGDTTSRAPATTTQPIPLPEGITGGAQPSTGPIATVEIVKPNSGGGTTNPPSAGSSGGSNNNPPAQPSNDKPAGDNDKPEGNNDKPSDGGVVSTPNPAKMTFTVGAKNKLTMGRDVFIPVTISIPSGTAGPSGIQFTLTFPDECMSFREATLTGFPGGKQVVSNVPDSAKNTVRVLVFGLDQDVISSGAVVNLKFSVFTDLGPAWNGAISLSEMVGAAPDGNTTIEADGKGGAVEY